MWRWSFTSTLCSPGAAQGGSDVPPPSALRGSRWGLGGSRSCPCSATNVCAATTGGHALAALTTSRKDCASLVGHDRSAGWSPATCLASSSCWTRLRGVASTCQCRQHPLIHDRLVCRWRIAAMAVATTTSIRHVHAGCPGLLQRRWRRPLLLRCSLRMRLCCRMRSGSGSRLCCLALLARPTSRLGALRPSVMPGAGCCSSARSGWD
jgi:hypothetical protein